MKVVEIQVSHFPHEVVWENGQPWTHAYACLDVRAVTDTGARLPLALVDGLGSTRIPRKILLCKRFFHALVGMDVSTANKEIFTFNQRLSWDEVKTGELY